MLQTLKTRALRATLMVALCALMIGGCAGNRESQLTGQWKIDAASMTASMPQGNTPQEKMGLEMAKKMFENITLDLKEDKTFTMNMMMEFGGNWKLDEKANTVALDMTTKAGQDISKMPNASKESQKPIVLNIGADNATLTMAVPGQTATAGEMKFIKVK